MADYITYADLKKAVTDTGRPYDLEMLDKAYALADAAHAGQFRRSGEPYICHPLNVALLLVELGMDSETIEAAIRRAAGMAAPDEVFAAGQQQRDQTYPRQHNVAQRAETWARMLLENRKASMLGDVRQFLSQAEGTNAGLFMVIQHDFTQAVYRLIQQQGIAASEMFRSEEDNLLYRNAVNSQFDLLRWMNRFSTRAAELWQQHLQSQSVAGKARAYIDTHYAEDISRQSLAERFFVTSDHLSHLFNRETGLSIPDYLTRTRVEQAKRLLLQGKTVSEAAQAVGYDNFAYFSTVFKKLEGVTPSEYRKARQGGQE